MQEEHGFLIATALGLLGLVFWMVRHMINKIEKRCDEIDEKHSVAEKKFLQMFDKHLEERDNFLKELMTNGDHKLICRATQAELKLHISKTAKDNRDALYEAIEKNQDVVMAAITELRKSMKDNGYTK